MGAASCVLRIGIAIVFSASAIAKSRQLGAFAATIREILAILGQKLSRRESVGIGAAVTICEAAVAGLAGAGRHAIVASTLTLALSFAFASSAFLAMRHRRSIRCSCFGSADSPLGGETIGRAGLLAVAAVGYVGTMARHPWWPAGIAEAVSVAAVIVGCLLLALWLLKMPTIVTLVRARRLSSEGSQA